MEDRVAELKKSSGDLGEFAKALSADVAKVVDCRKVFIADLRDGSRKLLGANYEVTDDYLKVLDDLPEQDIVRFPVLARYDGPLNFDDLLQLFQEDKSLKNCGFVRISDVDGNPALLLGLAGAKVNVKPKCHIDNKDYFEAVLYGLFPGLKPSPIPEGMDEEEIGRAHV